MRRLKCWMGDHPMLFMLSVTALVIALTVGLVIWAEASIPLCETCGQKQYHHEVAYYITTFTMVGKVMVPTQTPVYRTVQHACPGRKLYE